MLLRKKAFAFCKISFVGNSATNSGSKIAKVFFSKHSGFTYAGSTTRRRRTHVSLSKHSGFAYGGEECLIKLKKVIINNYELPNIVAIWA
jgi:hypothetical protein